MQCDNSHLDNVKECSVTWNSVFCLIKQLIHCAFGIKPINVQRKTKILYQMVTVVVFR